MHHRRFLIFSATLLLLSSAHVPADEMFGYTYVGVGLDRATYDVPYPNTADGRIGWIDAQLGLGDNFFAGASTALGSMAVNDRREVVVKGVSATLGAHYRLADSIDGVAAFDYAVIRYAYDNIDLVDDEVYTSGSLGLRYAASRKLELRGGLSMDLNQDSTDTSWSVGAIIYPVRRFGLGIDYSAGDDWSSVGIIARIYADR